MKIRRHVVLTMLTLAPSEFALKVSSVRFDARFEPFREVHHCPAYFSYVTQWGSPSYFAATTLGSQTTAINARTVRRAFTTFFTRCQNNCGSPIYHAAKMLLQRHVMIMKVPYFKHTEISPIGTHSWKMSSLWTKFVCKHAPEHGIVRDGSWRP